MSLDLPPENPIYAALNGAGVPWQMSRESLAERYGVRPHAAYGWDVIEIETLQPIVKGLLWPLSVQVFPQFSPYLPATDFATIAYFGDDARKNLRFTAKQLTPRLGEASVTDKYNTLGRCWTFGAAAFLTRGEPVALGRVDASNRNGWRGCLDSSPVPTSVGA
jgi:hypothetical protein